MSLFKDCVNCGKQNILDADYKPQEKCFSCGNPIGIKIKEEEQMISKKIHVDELPPNIKTGVLKKAAEDLPEIPPKPDTKSRVILGAYYEYNKRSILLYLDVVGEAQMLKKWNISYTTWYRIRHKWRPEQFPPRKSKTYRKKEKKAPAAGKPAKKDSSKTVPVAIIEDVDQADEVCARCPVYQAFKGYRLAVNEILVHNKNPKEVKS